MSTLLSRAGKAQIRALDKLAAPVTSIWVMALPDTAYQAPVGAFWFISSGMGR